MDKVTASKILRSLYLDVFCSYILFVILYASNLQEKGLRKKLQDETVKGIMLKVTPLRMEKHNSLLAKLKSEVVQAHDEVLKLKGAIPKGMI